MVSEPVGWWWHGANIVVNFFQGTAGYGVIIVSQESPVGKVWMAPGPGGSNPLWSWR